MKKILLLVSCGLISNTLSTLDCPECVARTLQGGVVVSKKTNKKPTRKELLSNSTYKAGVGFFNKKNYQAALGCFQFLDSDGFCCDLIHYYIGQCYQNTNQTVAAQQHFDWVMQRSKDPTLRAYADYANQTLAYYSSHRTYAGQGSVYDRQTGGGGGGGGGQRVGFG